VTVPPSTAKRGPPAQALALSDVTCFLRSQSSRYPAPVSDQTDVLVDLDGVLADFDGEVVRRMAVMHPEIVPRPDRVNFYIADDYAECRALVRAIYIEPGFFAELSLVDGALCGWQRLIDLGYHPRICSSPVTANVQCRAEKLAWLEEHLAPAFGLSVVDEAVITKDKHLVAGLALIDDRPKIASSEFAAWRHIIFDQPYNRGANGARLRGWYDEDLEVLLVAARTPR
jgi:5'-nucleotidase